MSKKTKIIITIIIGIVVLTVAGMVFSVSRLFFAFKTTNKSGSTDAANNSAESDESTAASIDDYPIYKGLLYYIKNDQPLGFAYEQSGDVGLYYDIYYMDDKIVNGQDYCSDDVKRYKSDTQYALYDIDGNGTHELIISNKQGRGILDMYTIKDDTLIHLCSGVIRGSFCLLKDGGIIQKWSGGAAFNGATYFSFDGYAMNFIEVYYSDYNGSDMVYNYSTSKDFEYDYETGCKDYLSSISEDEFEKAYNLADEDIIKLDYKGL